MNRSDYDGRGYDPPYEIPPDLSKELAAAETEIRELDEEIYRLRSALRGIRREFGHMSINNGTSTLGLFIDAALKNDVNYAKELESKG